MVILGPGQAGSQVVGPRARSGPMKPPALCVAALEQLERRSPGAWPSLPAGRRFDRGHGPADPGWLSIRPSQVAHRVSTAPGCLGGVKVQLTGLAGGKEQQARRCRPPCRGT